MITPAQPKKPAFLQRSSRNWQLMLPPRQIPPIGPRPYSTMTILPRVRGYHKPTPVSTHISFAYFYYHNWLPCPNPSLERQITSRIQSQLTLSRPQPAVSLHLGPLTGNSPSLTTGHCGIGSVAVVHISNTSSTPAIATIAEELVKTISHRLAHHTVASPEN